MFEEMGNDKWLELNAKLNQKKNELRKALKAKGILKREGKNDYGKYKYFSEAQYKELFTGLFSDYGLELKVSEVDYIPYEAEGNMNNGRIAKLEFTLTDIDTGFFETSVISGEGLDSGDKGGYKAYTGALKYYLADTFMVATGDDAEKETPEVKAYASDKDKKKLEEYCKKLDINPNKILKDVGWKPGTKITNEQVGKAMIEAKKVEDEKRLQQEFI